MADVCITDYTDPACPWAYSAEPFRRRLKWLYGDQIEWVARMVVLAESPEQYESRGFTVDKQSAAFHKISRQHGMPIDSHPRARMAATLPACRAVVAARVHAPDRARPLLRRLRVRHFARELLDDRATIDGAARDVGIDPVQLREWEADPQVTAELEEDKAGAREPLPAARVLDAKLAVLAWAGTPLATQEVALVRDISFEDAREELSRVAAEAPLGHDGFWSL